MLFPRSHTQGISSQPNFEGILKKVCTFRKYNNWGEISSFLKIHSTHVALCHGPEYDDQACHLKYVERTNVKLSNESKIIKNGLLTSAHDDRKVDTSKIVGSCSDNIDSRPRNTGDWHHSVLSHKQGGVAIQRHHGRSQKLSASGHTRRRPERGPESGTDNTVVSTKVTSI